MDLLAVDTEALLIRVPDHEPGEPRCHLVPIDACYEFVGRLRMLWRGFDGGSDAHRHIEEFFTTLAERSTPVPP